MQRIFSCPLTRHFCSAVFLALWGRSRKRLLSIVDLKSLSTRKHNSWIKPTLACPILCHFWRIRSGPNGILYGSSSPARLYYGLDWFSKITSIFDIFLILFLFFLDNQSKVLLLNLQWLFWLHSGEPISKQVFISRF